MRVIVIRAIDQNKSHLTNDDMVRMLEMSQWCKDQVLVHGKDYDYCAMDVKKEIHFRFFNEYESMGSMLELRI